MTIKLRIDEVPFIVSFSGVLDIGRMNSTEDVAIRKASEGTCIWGVSLDAKAVDKQAEIESRSRPIPHILLFDFCYSYGIGM